MTIIDVLMKRDPSVRRMTLKYLMDQPTPYVSDGWITQFLEVFDMEKGTWGGGIYGPKWVSTFYTLRDINSLEIDPDHPIYQQGLKTLVERMWNPERPKITDECIIAMLISMMVYGRHDPQAIEEMISYLVGKQMSDGGWNCAASRPSAHGKSCKSSVHTSLSVMEAYRDYDGAGFNKSLEMVRKQSAEGREYLLRKRLMRRESNGELIFSTIAEFHFPERWKYDVLKALVYFATAGHPYDSRMAEALDLLKARLCKGYLGRGSAHSGKLHFKMETGKLGSMNTLRGLRVLKTYDPEIYMKVISMETPDLD
jgi:hypothetical protein